jgi:hypothetical protein
VAGQTLRRPARAHASAGRTWAQDPRRRQAPRPDPGRAQGVLDLGRGAGPPPHRDVLRGSPAAAQADLRVCAVQRLIGRR